MWMARFCRSTATALEQDPALLFARVRMLSLSPKHAGARVVLPPTLSEAEAGVLSADLQVAQAAAYSAAMRQNGFFLVFYVFVTGQMGTRENPL